jgi:hypothetical protein
MAPTFLSSIGSISSRRTNMDKHSPSNPAEGLSEPQKSHTPGEKSGSVGYMLYVPLESSNYRIFTHLSSFKNKKCKIRPAYQLGPTRVSLAIDFCISLLRYRNDAHIDAQIRPGPIGDHLPCVTAAIRCYAGCWHGMQQDGTRTKTTLRPNARSEMGY